MHATEVIIRAKKPSNKPAKIAPITLVAAKLTAKRISESKIVPKIPIISVVNDEHIHLLVPLLSDAAVITAVMPRYTIAIPKVTHKNAGVRVMVALKVRNAVIMPIIILATTANTVQLGPQLQFVLYI